MSSRNESLARWSLDFYLSMLYASLNSYKMSSLIKPLPSFVNNSEELKECLDSIMYLPISISPSEVANRNNQFNRWVHNEAGNYDLQKFDPILYKDLLPSLSNVKHVPSFIIKIKDPTISENYLRLSHMHGTAIGFHGTHTENVISILKNGLCGHLNKRSLYGQGTYLSTDVDVAFSFSKQGKSWPLSSLGNNMMCVVMCQIIKSDQVKQGHEKLSGISIDNDTLPHNYFVVQNNDHAIVTHVLLYVTRRKKLLNNWFQQSYVFAFFRCYGFVLLYALILLLICSTSKFNLVKKWFK